MSATLNLVKYKSDDDGNLYEEGYEIVDTVFISPDLISELENDFSLEEVKLYEDGRLGEYYSINCFPIDKTVEIYLKLEKMFITVLMHEAEGCTENKESSGSKEVSSKKEFDIGLSVDRFRTITNVIYLVRLKRDKFLDDSSVVLKLG